MSDEDRKGTGKRHVVDLDTDDLGELSELLVDEGPGDDRRAGVHRIDLDDSAEDFDSLLHRTLGEAAGEPVPPPSMRPVRDAPGSPAPRREAREGRVIEDLRSRVKELTSETDAFRKRITEEAKGARASGREDVCRRLLPVIDALELALGSARDGHDVDKLVRGLELVHKQLVGELAAVGLEEFDPTGEPFDPSAHEAFQKRRTGTVTPGRVNRIIRRGYRFHGRLLRAAQVVVEDES